MKTNRVHFSTLASVNSLETMAHVIETDPDAFLEGRRNDDMVNWFIVQKLINLESGEATMDKSEFIDRFKKVHNRLPQPQKDSLWKWEEDWEYKIGTLFDYYGKVDDPAKLINLWLPMDYSI